MSNISSPKTAHTPGPWFVGERASTRVRDGADTTIAVAGLASRVLEEARANAHLIAAAPQLLEALKDQLQLMVGYKSRLEIDGAFIAARQVDDRIEVVSAIVLKAEGGAE